MPNTRMRLLTVLGLVAATVSFSATAAFASCHRFTLELSDERVFEGDTLTITVGRIGAAGDSSVVVSAVPGTASAGDFSALEERLGFVGSEREKSVEMQIVDDTEREATESFSIHLSAPQGCAGGPAFVLAGDIPVTIIANDQTPAPPAPPDPAEPEPEPEPSPPAEEPAEEPAAPEEEPEPQASPEPSPEPSPSASPSPEAGEAPDDDGTDLAAAEEEEAPSVPVWVFLALAGAVLVTALFVYLQLGREHAPPPSSG